jgi:uncharacterized protein
MPVAPTYPGVYVQEVPSGVRTIVGVSTAIGMLIGTARKGPINNPVWCGNYNTFKETFGDDFNAGQLAAYVRLFFLNGGGECYAMRIANGASPASIDLKTEAAGGFATGVPTLRLIAKNAGLEGNNLRAMVTYSGPQPEVTFNIELFNWVVDSSGRPTKQGREIWRNLTMDPTSSAYAVDFLTQNSALVNATDLNASAVLAAVKGSSTSGRAMTPGALATLLSTKNKFEISVDGSPYIMVDTTAFPTTIAGIVSAINAAFVTNLMPTISVTGGPVAALWGGNRVQIASANGDVLIRPFAGAEDLAAPIMFGTAQGGIEVSSKAQLRPAPTAITTSVDFALLSAFGNALASTVNSITLEGVNATGAIVPVPPFVLKPETVLGGKVFRDAYPAASSVNGNNDGLREKLEIIAQQINALPSPPNTQFAWTAEVWGSRLAIIPGDIFPDNYVDATFAAAAPLAAIIPATMRNVRFYKLGSGGPGQQSGPVLGNDGDKPKALDYDNAYDKIDKEVDLYNLMALPPDSHPTVPIQSLYANASIRCERRRAFLLMDPPASWTNPSAVVAGLTALRTGLVKDYSAVFFPRITINEDGVKRNIGPAGAIAGLCARIDGTRGVWKAPAGTEADLRGIIGLEQNLSDVENGRLNPRAINTIRVFESGIVNWGARTNYGDDNTPHDYKYLPIRRLALFMEESLYRGLKWAVFEPNDEPLWAQIRLNVGAFMHNLFRQGAFQGRTPREAYFVKCDAETTPQNARNLGMVNIWVGFAPLKPAEFVILYLQQMAGQIET